MGKDVDELLEILGFGVSAYIDRVGDTGDGRDPGPDILDRLLGELDGVDVVRIERRGNGVPGPEAWDRLEAGQMYEGGVDKGQDPDILPGAVLHVHDQVPLSPVQDGGIDI
jgi:hypothetical protein